MKRHLSSFIVVLLFLAAIFSGERSYADISIAAVFGLADKSLPAMFSLIAVPFGLENP